MDLEQILRNDDLSAFKQELSKNKKILKHKFSIKDSPILLFSVRVNADKIFSYLLKNKLVSVNARDNEGTSALNNACMKNDIKKVKMLLKQDKIIVNSQTMYGKNGLINASQKGYTKIVELLLKHGANVRLRETTRTKKSCSTRNAFNMSRICGHQNIHHKLTEQKARNNSQKKRKGRNNK